MKFKFKKKSSHLTPEKDNFVNTDNNITDKTTTNLLEGTVLLDKELSVIQEMKSEDIQVIDLNKHPELAESERVINLEKELSEVKPGWKKTRIFSYILFAILVVLVIIMVTIVAAKLK